MQVAVYADPGPDPFLHVLSAGLDDLQTAITKFLDPQGIQYAIVDDTELPDSRFILGAITISVSNGLATFGWDMGKAQTLATQYNSAYWQNQYDAGLLGLSVNNEYLLNLAIATPAAERTADQVAAVEFLTGISGLQTAVQDQIDAATTGEELIQILSNLG